MTNTIADIVENTGISTEKVEEIMKAIEGVNFFDISEEEGVALDRLNQEGVLDWEWIPYPCGCCGYEYVEKKIKGPKGMVTIK